MNTKLDNVTTQYRKFNVNQVLTEGQLNEFIDYFEDQDRLSRTHLSGVGVACGFKTMYFDASVTKETIKQIFKIEEDKIDLQDYIDTIGITQGTGVTTDGDLITLRRKTLKILPDSEEVIETAIDFKANAYKYYRNYEVAKEYKHFIINDEPVNFLEVITQQDYDFLIDQGISVSGFQPVKEIQKLNEKIVILYLESYSNEEPSCQDADCNKAGSEQVSNLRVLLADQNEIADIIEESEAKDTLYQLSNTYEDLFKDLHSIEAKRVILDPGVSTAPQLKSKFIDAIHAISELSDGFTSIAKTFNVSLNIGNQSLKDKLEALLYTSPSGADDYQYRYDLLKDLIDTHNEIRSLVLHLHAECCPSISSFPKHLFLGPLGAKLELGENTPLRHGFFHSPITTGDDENYERIVMLANRFVQKVNGFRAYSGPVKITPSHLNVRLGDKAIPYYYNVDQSLLSKWNYEKTKTDRETYNLSYHTANLAGEDFIQNPLNYNLDDSDFYRIEGHLGLPFETAVQNINDLKAKYGLAFDVIVLLLNDKRISESELAEPVKVSIPELRARVLSISNDISKATGDSKSTLLNLSKLDSQLRLLNKAKFDLDTGSEEEVEIIKEDPRKKEITTELLKDFLERKSGLEHMAGVRPGDTFVLIAESETNNLVLADFTLPYLCCSKEKPNIPPLAKDDYTTCMIGKTVVISVLDNDYDPDNNPLTVVKKSDPYYGSVVLNSSGTFTYTHDGSANLEDAFTYCVNDGRDDSNIATVFIKVKSAPVAVNDHASTSNGGYVDIAVKDNDYDLGNTPLSVFINTQPAHGTATLRPDGKIRYTHDGSNTLMDSFTYHINDGELDSNIATVTVKIGPPPCNSGMDVVFIFDYTGSMGGQIEAAKTGASSIITTIQNQSSPNAYRLGIVLADETDSRTNSGYSSAAAYTSLPASQRFVNTGIGSKFQWITAMEVMSENNVTTFTNQLNKINNPGGGLSLGWGVGGPEPTDMALSRVVEYDFAGAFRNNVAKYVIIITDITPGGNDDIANGVDVTELNRLKNICLAKSIKVIVLGAGVDQQIQGKYIWRELANGTGGSWNSSYNASAIQTAIINGCGG
jgi:hypothetical protein